MSSENPNKLLGYLFIFVGVGVIIFAGASVYQVFTKRADPVNLFDLPGISFDTSDIIQSSIPPEYSELLEAEGSTQTSQKSELIPSAVLNDTSNIFAHLFFMGFIASIGFKIANLGVQLVRPIVVKLKEAKTA